jgi:lysophospholipase L1-like esterase
VKPGAFLASLGVLAMTAGTGGPLRSSGAAAQPGPQHLAAVEPEGALAAFRRALARAREGTGLARIVYLGDSAVVSDGMTGELRRRLQRRYGDGGAGFVLAGKPWPWYVRQNVRHSGSGWDHPSITRNGTPDLLFGLPFLRAVAPAGTRARAVWETDPRGPVGGRVSRFELWTLARPGGGTAELRIDGGTPHVIATRADRPTPAYEVFEVPDGPHAFALETRGDGPVEIFGAVLERQSGVVVDAIGINGAHSVHFLRGDPALLADHLRRRAPDLVAVQLGTNMATGLRPSTHGDRVLQLVRRLRQRAPGASCLLVTPPDRARVRADGTEDTPAYIPAVVAETERVARAAGCASWNAFAAMGGAGSFARWRTAGLASGDTAHLTLGGYARLARMLDEALTGERVADD